jgi:serine/threonine protein kinase
MVYKALDKETSKLYINLLDVLVALKKIIFNSKNKKARSIVEREIDTLKKIDHPNIIKLLDFKIKETKATLVLEYCEYDLMYII